MHNIIKGHIAEVLDLRLEQIPLERPKEQRFGHYATPVAFMLAKQRRTNPKELASHIAEQFSSDCFFAEVSAVGGFVNFRLSAQTLERFCQDALSKGDSFGRQNKHGRILIEFVSANPTGPLHIGHARGAVLGDCLANLARHLGYEVCTEYYVNDAGKQIALLGLSIWLAARSLLGLETVYPQSYYRGEYINDIAQKAIETYSTQAFEAAQAEETLLCNLADMGKDIVLDEIKDSLMQLGIVFDNFVSEKQIYAQWDCVYKRLLHKGALYEHEGKLWLKSTSFDDKEDRVIVRENGEPTYLAADIVYHVDKFERGYDTCINIWGADHHGYITRVKASLQWLGFDATRLEVLLSQMVNLLKDGSPYKMSKRAGNYILLSDVMDDMNSDVLRFVFLSKKSDTHLEFDVSDFNAHDVNNPVYYIHYAHARIHTLFERSNKTPHHLMNVSLLPLLESDSTLAHDCMDLAFLSLQLSQVIDDAFASRNLVKMTDYLKNLASAFHRFYNTYKILNSPLEKELLKLCMLVACCLSLGLRLLGITAKKHIHKQIQG